VPRKKKARHLRDGLVKNGELIVDSAKIIADSSDPVKLIDALIRHQKLIATAYRNHRKVKG